MEIDLDKKAKEPKAEEGDIVKFHNKVIALVLRNDEVAIFKDVNGDDLVCSCSNYHSELNGREYKILAKAKEWKIVRR